MYDLYVISYSSISHLSPMTLTVEWGLFRQVLACVFTGKNGGNSAGYSSKPSSLIHPWNTGRFEPRKCMICYMDFYRRKTISNPMFTRKNVPQIFMVKLTPLNKLRCCNYPLRHLWLQRGSKRRSVCQASGVYVGSICICGVSQVECQQPSIFALYSFVAAGSWVQALCRNHEARICQTAGSSLSICNYVSCGMKYG